MVYFPVSSCLASNTVCPLYKFIKDKTLGLIIAHNFNISLTI